MSVDSLVFSKKVIYAPDERFLWILMDKFYRSLTLEASKPQCLLQPADIDIILWTIVLISNRMPNQSNSLNHLPPINCFLEIILNIL